MLSQQENMAACGRADWQMRIENDSKWRKEIFELCKNIRGQAVSNIEHYSTKKSATDDRFKEIFTHLYDHLDKGVEKHKHHRSVQPCTCLAGTAIPLPQRGGRAMAIRHTEGATLAKTYGFPWILVKTVRVPLAFPMGLHTK